MPIQNTNQACRLPLSTEALEEVYKEILAPIPPVPLDEAASTQTIYEILSETSEATSFFKLLQANPSIAELVKSTNNVEYTVFVPIESSWSSSSSGYDNLIDEQRLSVHISPHYFPVDAFSHMPNIPTTLRSANGNGPQILKARYSISKKWSINGNALLRPNIRASNGLIHFIDGLIPLPKDIVTVVSDHSDLTYTAKALQITGLGEQLSNGSIKGKTILALHDGRFRALGPEILEFLFETEEGKKYLTALMKYNIFPSTTFFSNLIWPKNDSGSRATSEEGLPLIKGKRDMPLNTMLIGEDGEPKGIAITVARYGCLISMEVNGYSKIMDCDILGSDGSAHIVRDLVLPRHLTDEEMNDKVPSLQGIKNALGPYV